VSPTRPHGRRGELRAARRVLLDLTASFEAREAARETLLELLEAKRSNGRSAYSLRHAAAKALYDDPATAADILVTPAMSPPLSPSRTSRAQQPSGLPAIGVDRRAHARVRVT